MMGGMAPVAGMAPYGMAMPPGGAMMMPGAGMQSMYSMPAAAYNMHHVILTFTS